MKTIIKPKKIKIPKKTSDQFTLLIKSLLNVDVKLEHKFHPVRMWRFDYAILEHKIAIEVEGGSGLADGGGRHNRPKGFANDIEKYNNAVLLGWRLIRVLPRDLYKVNTVEMIKQLIIN